MGGGGGGGGMKNDLPLASHRHQKRGSAGFSSKDEEIKPKRKLKGNESEVTSWLENTENVQTFESAVRLCLVVL